MTDTPLPDINLWLDDDKTSRKPPVASGLNWTWAYTAEEAMKIIDTGRVIWASLDHDLADDHYIYFHSKLKECHDRRAHKANDNTACFHCLLTPDDPNWLYPVFKEKTGMDVLTHIEATNQLPKHGIRIHTMNPARKVQMLSIVNKLYGQTFQVQ